MPKNINFDKSKNKFRASKNYKKSYKGIFRETVEEALKDLEEINKTIELLKQIEKDEHNKKEITRNNEGIPYIKVQDTEVLVDEKFWHELNNISWKFSNGYIKNGKEGFMHRFIIKAKKGEIVDHINNIKHDNREDNLRIANAGLNSHNKTKKIMHQVNILVYLKKEINGKVKFVLKEINII
jgi:hypothetical protein